MERWVGLTDCQNYEGIHQIKIRRCCGGHSSERVHINCKVHVRTDASRHCRKGVCEHYKRRNDDVGEG